MSALPAPSQIPEQCDLGIVTVIDVESRQLLKAFDIPKRPGQRRGAFYFWETTVYSQEAERNLKIVICCIGKPGMVRAAVRTAAFLQYYRPTMMILVGIAAGWRPKQRIGNVVWPRHVVEISATEVLAEGPAFRPAVHMLKQEVVQMLQWWAVKEHELAAHTERILDGQVVPGRERTDAVGLEVCYPPKAGECVLACGDYLVRHDAHFTKLHAIDRQVQACEMESAGMVIALADVAPDIGWLQVRGISDFGDVHKDSGWHIYAAAAAGAFVRLFAEQCFDPDLLLGVREAAPGVTAPTGTAISRRSVAMSIPAEQIEMGPSAAAILQDFATIKEGWKRNRDTATGGKLQTMRAKAEFAGAAADVRARILRFEAKVIMETTRDKNAAKALAEEADALAGHHRITKALFIVAESGPAAAAELLDQPANLEEWNQRMGYWLQAKQTAKVLQEWDSPPEGVGPDVESHRLKAYALVMEKRLAEARVAFGKIAASHRGAFAIRLQAGVLDYYEAVSSAAPKAAFEIVPVPVPVGFIKRDETSTAALDRAEQVFREMAEAVPEKNDFHYELQGWRLAAMALNSRRRSEAEELCRQLLEERPGEVQFLNWAEACDFRIEREKNIAALAAKLGVAL